MQRMSHLTRVYFVNENRLKGFLVQGEEGMITSLKNDNLYYANELTKHYKFDFDMLVQTLKEFLVE